MKWTMLLSIAVWGCWMMGGRSAAEEGGKSVGARAAEASNRFGWDLYARLAEGEKGNLFFSPFSIESALAMTYGGARGATAEQMGRVLHLEPPAEALHASFAGLTAALNESGAMGEHRLFELVAANALWGQKGFAFQPAYVRLVKEKYGAGIETVDFAGGRESREQARRAINAWVEERTHDKIREMLGAGVLTEQTRLVLTNAVYFKSRWDAPFAKAQTRTEPFAAGAGESIDVAMMHQRHRLRYMENADVQAVELPYMLNRLSMMVLLPRAREGLAGLEKSLSAANVAAWSGALEERDVELSLPKFEFSSGFGLGRVLAGMGMKEAFEPTADFSGMSSASPLFIGDVIHRAFVAVDEEGTEAAAATAIVMRGAAMRQTPEKAVFRADHPFVFVIREEGSGVILFVGRVSRPGKGGV